MAREYDEEYVDMILAKAQEESLTFPGTANEPDPLSMEMKVEQRDYLALISKTLKPKERELIEYMYGFQTGVYIGLNRAARELGMDFDKAMRLRDKALMRMRFLAEFYSKHQP